MCALAWSPPVGVYGEQGRTCDDPSARVASNRSFPARSDQRCCSAACRKRCSRGLKKRDLETGMVVSASRGSGCSPSPLFGPVISQQTADPTSADADLVRIWGPNNISGFQLRNMGLEATGVRLSRRPVLPADRGAVMADHDDITQTAMFLEAAAEARKESHRYWESKDQGLPEGVQARRLLRLHAPASVHLRSDARALARIKR